MISGVLIALLLGRVEALTAPSCFYLLLAFFSARQTGMTLNRIIDQEIDKKNPRTKERALSCGDVTLIQAYLVALTSIVLLFFSCYMINHTLFILSPFIVCLLLLYSYTKRVTSMCHFVLGLIHSLCPLLAFAAITRGVSFEVCLLAFAQLLVIASGDIFYAMQDIDFDVAEGLFSIPAVMGKHVAMKLAFCMQLAAVLSLVCLGWFMGFSSFYFASCAACLLAYVIAFLRKRPVFYMNSYVGLAIMLSLFGEYLWQK